ncbi:MAG TPA: hypothetical protein VHF91_10270, partial [Acidimicrobiales bacterium]|nr:hypothetical protein [Acidimicrobiales bacterium]
MTDRVDVVVVSGEPLWPPHHGGRIRGARIVEELGRRFRVLTVAPVQGAVPAGVRVEPLPDELRTSRVFAVASPQPRLGRALLGPRRLAVLREVLVRERPAVLLFASGYLAARVPDAWLPVAVDFVDVDVRRMASLAGSRGATLRSRGSAAVERVKARRWEPEVARRAVLAASPSNDDVELLRSWGAAAVHVPHGADRHDVTPSPVTGPVTFVASFTYAPNVHAARFVLQE